MLANAHHPIVKHVHVLWDGDISQMALDAINNITAAERAKFFHVRIPRRCCLSVRCRDWPVRTLDSDCSVLQSSNQGRTRFYDVAKYVCSAYNFARPERAGGFVRIVLLTGQVSLCYRIARYANTKLERGAVVLLTNSDISINGGFACDTLSEHNLPLNTMLVPQREEPPCIRDGLYTAAGRDWSMNCGCSGSSRTGNWMCFDSCVRPTATLGFFNSQVKLRGPCQSPHCEPAMATVSLHPTASLHCQ